MPAAADLPSPAPTHPLAPLLCFPRHCFAPLCIPETQRCFILVVFNLGQAAGQCLLGSREAQPGDAGCRSPGAESPGPTALSSRGSGGRSLSSRGWCRPRPRLSFSGLVPISNLLSKERRCLFSYAPCLQLRRKEAPENAALRDTLLYTSVHACAPAHARGIG